MTLKVGQILYLIDDDTAIIHKRKILKMFSSEKGIPINLIEIEGFNRVQALSAIRINPPKKQYGMSFTKLFYRNGVKCYSAFSDEKLAMESLINCVLPAKIEEEQRAASGLIDLYNQKVSNVQDLEERIKAEKLNFKKL